MIRPQRELSDAELLAEIEKRSRAVVDSMAISGFTVSEEMRRQLVQSMFEKTKSGESDRRIKEAMLRFSKPQA